MSREKVGLYTRVSENGRRRYKRVNPKKPYPLGTRFFLRYCDPATGKRIWEPIRADRQDFVIDGKAAIAKARIKEGEVMLGQPTPTPKPAAASDGNQTLADAIQRYVGMIAEAKSLRTSSAYEFTLKQFQKTCSKTRLRDITSDDLMTFAISMKQDGLSDRTISNRVSEVVTFLRKNGYREVTLKWKYTEKKVRAYRPDELKTLFSAATPDEWLLFQFFLGTGAREQEGMYACWEDIDFQDGIFTVREHLDLGFRPKDCEEREVPLPDHLVGALKQRFLVNGNQRLIFPNPRTGRPEGHFLRKLKDLAKRAGLNPDDCGLHKFRKSYATLQHENGTSARTIQRRLGHSALETTLAYLEAADVRSEESRRQVNGVFAAFA